MKTTFTFLFLFTLAAISAQNDSIKLKLKLRDINGTLTFNQPHVSPNALEYAWEVKFDSDNNASTGDAHGFDVGIAMVNYKYASSLSYTGSIISGTEQYTRIFSNNTISYGHPVNAYFVPADTSIVLTAPASVDELATIHAGNPMFVYTYFNSPTGVETDSIPLSSLDNKCYSDAVNDVQSSFVDITSLEVYVPAITSIANQTVAQESIRVYPNPCSDHFFISASHVDAPVVLYNAQGNCVLRTNKNEINTSELTKGIYCLIVTTGNQKHASKLIIE